jgi:hypothetical protein
LRGRNLGLPFLTMPDESSEKLEPAAQRPADTGYQGRFSRVFAPLFLVVTVSSLIFFAITKGPSSGATLVLPSLSALIFFIQDRWPRHT